MSERVVNVGLLGCGNVGTAVVALLRRNADQIALRSGCRLEVIRIAVRDTSLDRGLDPELFTSDPAEVVADPDVDVVCELMGGIEPARSLILDAFSRGKPVVTANKELLANDGKTVFDAALDRGTDLYFEAAVAGGIPLIRPMKESLAGERVVKILGIVNGTTNYILTQMTSHGWGFEQALQEAKRLGYAESDPTADVEGFDAAAKCAILASIAFNARVVASDVYREGITAVTDRDIAAATRMGYVVKLLAIAELQDEAITARVHPAMVPSSHPLAAVGGAFNAVFVEGEKVGQLMFYGRGAGGDATSTAVVGDLVAVARNISTGGRGIGCTCRLSRRIRPMDDTFSQYYLSLHVEDRPGVLAEIADRFGGNGVSIERVWQEGEGEEAKLVFVTHRAQEGGLQKTVDSLSELAVVRRVDSVLRVEGEE